MKKEFFGFFFLQGVLAIIIGLIALLFPGVTLLAAVTIFIAFLVIEGIFSFIYGIVTIGQKEVWWLFILYGVLSFGLGLSLINMPTVTIKTLSFIMAVWGIVSAVSQLVRGFTISRSFAKELYLIVSGFLTLITSMILFFFPIKVLSTLTWVLGIYFIVLGVFTIAQMFRLKNLTEQEKRK